MLSVRPLMQGRPGRLCFALAPRAGSGVRTRGGTHGAGQPDSPQMISPQMITPIRRRAPGREGSGPTQSAVHEVPVPAAAQPPGTTVEVFAHRPHPLEGDRNGGARAAVQVDIIRNRSGSRASADAVMVSEPAVRSLTSGRRLSCHPGPERSGREGDPVFRRRGSYRLPLRKLPSPRSAGDDSRNVHRDSAPDPRLDPGRASRILPAPLTQASVAAERRR